MTLTLSAILACAACGLAAAVVFRLASALVDRIAAHYVPVTYFEEMRARRIDAFRSMPDHVKQLVTVDGLDFDMLDGWANLTGEERKKVASDMEAYMDDGTPTTAQLKEWLKV